MIKLINLLKEVNQSQYKIYVDMDGVLVDFEVGVVEHITSMLQSGEAEDLKTQINRDYATKEDLTNKKSPIRGFMYKNIEHHTDFWENLEWMPDGKELWNFVGPLGVAILTTPLKYGSEIGKQAWIDNNLTPAPEKVYMSKEKYRWAASNRILIDDFPKNTIPWEEAGGIAILHTNTNKTIQELKEILNETY